MKDIFQNDLDLLKSIIAKNNYLGTIAIEKKIKERVFTVKDTGVNYRWLDHWHSKGLLFSSYDSYKWKKFNLVEFVWIKIICKLREFNMSLKTVSAVKEIVDSDLKVEDIFKTPGIDFYEMITQFAPSMQSRETKILLDNPEILKTIKEARFNLLEMFILDTLLTGSYYSILIKSNGTPIPFKYSYIEFFSLSPEFRDVITGSYVSISITEILRDYIMSKDITVNNKKRLSLLTDEETLILNTIRQDDLKSVIIHFDKRNKMNLLEEVKERKIDKGIRLAELVLSKGYQDITIKTQDGEIVYCENKRKQLIQKE